jgi:type I restriction enzyme S subunit
MKDSGVEWIGEIPDGWKVKRLKYILTERNERSITGSEPLFMMSQIHGLVVRAEYHEKAEVANTSEGNKIVFKNDLVFNKLKAHLGVFFKTTIDYNGLVSPDYAVYYSNGIIDDVKYLEYLFRCPEYLKQFICRITGIVEGLMRLYTHDLFDISIPVPTKTEQKEILDFINNSDIRIAKAISLKEQEIEKLKEFKASLINSAVTGKIKVHNDAE